jgi:hypothetical protein
VMMPKPGFSRVRYGKCFMFVSWPATVDAV